MDEYGFYQKTSLKNVPNKHLFQMRDKINKILTKRAESDRDLRMRLLEERCKSMTQSEKVKTFNKLIEDFFHMLSGNEINDEKLVQEEFDELSKIVFGSDAKLTRVILG